MATITDAVEFIKVTEDSGKVTDFNKEDITYSCKGSDFFIKDNSGTFIRLPYSTITAPASANIYALRDAITAMIT